MQIKQRSTKYLSKTTRRAALPSWTNLVGALAIVAVIIIVVIKSLSGHTTVIPTISGTIPYTTPTTTTSTPGSTAPPAGTTVSLPTSAGGFQSVPTSALSSARAAAIALYTGNFANVHLAPHAAYHAPSTYYPSPIVTSPSVAGPGSATLTFYFDVQPSASAATQRASITVEDVSGVWSWIGEAS